MNEKYKYRFKYILKITLWFFAGGALFVLLLSAMHRNKQLHCIGIDISIEGYNHEVFINNEEVKKMLEKELNCKIVGSALEQLDLRKLERSLQQNPWISKAQLFVDNQQLLHVNISERMPVARVFTIGGQSFYMDSSAMALPLSDNEIANVPVFTNIPNEANKMTTQDSMLWKEVSKMGNFIKKDSFLLMQIGQIDITPKGTYVMYPAIGNHWIEFGTADNYELKLKRLATFYKKIFGQVGINKYEVIDLRYDKQIVATLRGKSGSKADPATAMKTFENQIKMMVKEANDTIIKHKIDENEKAGSVITTNTPLQPVEQSATQDTIAKPIGNKLSEKHERHHTKPDESKNKIKKKKN